MIDKMVSSEKGLFVERLCKTFDEKQVLNDLSFSVLPNEIVVILGPSGCGKTTLLNIIAGIETPDSGDIQWFGNSVLNTPVHKRNFGLMFQDYALFPHLNVYENIAFGLRMKRKNKSEIDKEVSNAMRLVGVESYAKRSVMTLSGGEKQRVALARSLAPHPELLMLDEPLGSLDFQLREQLVGELRTILRTANQTTIYVTHDQGEAFSLADRMIIMNQGSVVQSGTPDSIYLHPKTVFVAQFLGMNNIMRASVSRRELGYVLETPIGRFDVTGNQPPGSEVPVLVRPDGFSIADRYSHKLDGRILKKIFRGSITRLQIVTANNRKLVVDIPTKDLQKAKDKESIQLSFEPENTIQVLDD